VKKLTDLMKNGLSWKKSFGGETNDVIDDSNTLHHLY